MRILLLLAGCVSNGGGRETVLHAAYRTPPMLDSGVVSGDSGAAAAGPPLFATNPSWEVLGTPGSDEFAGAVDAGDVNGDGLPDLLLASCGTPRLFVYLGSGVGLPDAPTQVLETDPAACAMASAGDVDGDGFDDVVVGAGGRGEGYLYHGSSAGLQPRPDLLSGPGAFGTIVDGAGDVNGDGYDDVLFAWRGAALVYLGAPGRLSPTGATTIEGAWFKGAGVGDVNGDGYEDIALDDSDADALEFFFGGPSGVSTTPDASESVGWLSGLAGLGDVDGDGYDDVAAGTDHWGVDVYLGGPTGPVNAGSWGTGGNVGPIGDVNADGYDDLLVACVACGTNSAALYLGGAGGLATSATTTVSPMAYVDYGEHIVGSDFDGDGYSDVVVADDRYFDTGAAYVYLGTADAALPLLRVYTGTTDDDLGAAVANAGDVNGDGRDDVLVGAPGYLGGQGRAALYLGGPEGPGPTPSVQWFGTLPFDRFGFSLNGAGDVDGDGYDDLVVGAPLDSLGPGAVFLYRGSATGPSATATTELTAPHAAFGTVVRGVGDLDGDGFADIAVGCSASPVVYTFYGDTTGLSTTWISVRAVTRAEGLFGAGDVDGDGYDDLGVQVPTHAYDTGLVEIFMGGSAGIGTYVDAGLSGAAPGDEFGSAAVGIGDANGDGYDDIAIGAWAAAGGDGQVSVFDGSATGVASASVVLDGAEGGMLGRHVMAPGDLDGDGYADLLAKGGAGPNGPISMFLGSSAGVTSEPAAEFEAGTSLGGPITTGDFEGDGLVDLLVGEPLADGGAGAAKELRGGVDADGDGYIAGEDCDDADESVVPARVYEDADGDGYGRAASWTLTCGTLVGHVPDATDCDDTAETINPGVPEICDDGDVDEDCDGASDDADDGALGKTYFYQDLDGDLFGDATSVVRRCDAQAGWAPSDDDCDDTDASIHPAATEVCDTDDVDQDCDGLADELDPDLVLPDWYSDADGDGYGLTWVGSSCDPIEGAAESGGDCDDTNAAVNPGAAEICDPDDVDEDCDGTADDRDRSATGETTGFADTDEDGWGALQRTACDHVVDNEDDCDDHDADVHPGGAEQPGDRVDGDCDGSELCFVDADLDGYRSEATTTVGDLDCAGTAVALATAAIDCDDTHSATHEGAEEVPGDEVDEDCDGKEWCWPDSDQDGYGRDGTTRVESEDPDCADPGELPTSAPDGDCNDWDAAAHPGADPGCGGDLDCDGVEDADCDSALDDSARDSEPGSDARPPRGWHPNPAVDTDTGCGCSGTGNGTLALPALLAALVLRRRTTSGRLRAQRS